MRRIHEAKLANADTVTIWGTGTPRREFLFADDLADALLFLARALQLPLSPSTWESVQISPSANLPRRLPEVVGWQGELLFDVTKPDGTPRKLLDVSRLTALGWKASTPIGIGIRRTYEWFLANESSIRDKCNARTRWNVDLFIAVPIKGKPVRQQQITSVEFGLGEPWPRRDHESPCRSPMKPAHQLKELFAITNPSTRERSNTTSNG